MMVVIAVIAVIAGRSGEVAGRFVAMTRAFVVAAEESAQEAVVVSARRWRWRWRWRFVAAAVLTEAESVTTMGRWRRGRFVAMAFVIVTPALAMVTFVVLVPARAASIAAEAETEFPSAGERDGTAGSKAQNRSRKDCRQT